MARRSLRRALLLVVVVCVVVCVVVKRPCCPPPPSPASPPPRSPAALLLRSSRGGRLAAADPRSRVAGILSALAPVGLAYRPLPAVLHLRDHRLAQGGRPQPLGGMRPRRWRRPPDAPDLGRRLGPHSPHVPPGRRYGHLRRDAGGGQPCLRPDALRGPLGPRRARQGARFGHQRGIHHGLAHDQPAGCGPAGSRRAAGPLVRRIAAAARHRPPRRFPLRLRIFRLAR